MIYFLLGFSVTLNILFILTLIIVIKYKKKFNNFFGINNDEIVDIDSFTDFFRK